MTYLRILITLGAMLYATQAPAQISGPVLGYMPDAGNIRTVYGIPGAAVVGDTFERRGNLAHITVSPRQNYILATAADTGEALLITPGGSQARLTGVAAGADRILLSPRGSAAAFWFSATNRFEIVSGLPGAPAVVEIDATFRGSAPGASAVSDDGQWLAGVWPDGVYALGATGQVNLLPVDASAAALAFFHNRPDLAAVTPTTIVTVTGVGGGAVPSRVYDSSASPLSPVAIALSFDNLHLTAADQTGRLVTVDLSSGTPAVFDCGCIPEDLFALGGSIFRLDSLRHGPLTLFDAATGDLLLVPPPARAGGVR